MACQNTDTSFKEFNQWKVLVYDYVITPYPLGKFSPASFFHFMKMKGFGHKVPTQQRWYDASCAVWSGQCTHVIRSCRGLTFIPEMMTSSALFTMFLKKPPNISLAFFLRTVSYSDTFLKREKPTMNCAEFNEKVTCRVEYWPGNWVLSINYDCSTR